MTSVADAARDFLSQKRIAVAGVSREAAGHGGNVVYQRLRSRGYEVFAVNPKADRVEGDPCYHDLAAIPGGVDAVVVATNPTDSAGVIADCERLGVKRAWIHRSFGDGSVSDAAVAAGRKAGMTVIVGGCPLMFDPTADFGHKCMKVFVGLTGSRPTVA